MSITGQRPERGVRVHLELTTEASAAPSPIQDTVHYRGSLATPESVWTINLLVALDSGHATVNWEPQPSGNGEPTSDALDFARQLGRQAHRLACRTAREEGGGSWPRRIQRWRES